MNGRKNESTRKKRYEKRNTLDTKDRRRRVSVIRKEIMKQKRLKHLKKVKELKIECDIQTGM